jgi:hypothetical protein
MWQQRARLTNGIRDALGIPEGQIASVDDLIDAARKAHKAEQNTAAKQVTELVEAIKTLSVQQAQMAELLRDVVTKALPAMQAQMVKLTAMIEGKGGGNYRPN